jgi:hypothetical protein
MVISIFWSSCHQLFIIYILLITGGILSILSCYNLASRDERIFIPPHGNKIVAVHTSGKNNNPNIAW